MSTMFITNTMLIVWLSQLILSGFRDNIMLLLRHGFKYVRKSPYFIMRIVYIDSMSWLPGSDSVLVLWWYWRLFSQSNKWALWNVCTFILSLLFKRDHLQYMWYYQWLLLTSWWNVPALQCQLHLWWVYFAPVCQYHRRRHLLFHRMWWWTSKRLLVMWWWKHIWWGWLFGNLHSWRCVSLRLLLYYMQSYFDQLHFMWYSQL